MEKDAGMIYRFLGRTGMKVSVIGLGTMAFKELTPEKINGCYECITKAYEKGVNFFDTAERYGDGTTETILGQCIKKAGWARKDFVLSTKIYHCGNGPNDSFLSRKHIIEGVTASLSRLQLDYADILFAHRYDPATPIEETCRAFNWLIDAGRAFHWGTSEWTAEQIMEAFECCDRLGLIRPAVDQVEYSLLARHKLEVEFVPLFEKFGYGTTTWSPLAGGFLTGKYSQGSARENARYSDAKMDPLVHNIMNVYIGKDEEKFYKKLRALGEIAKEMKCTQPQLALAWVLVNKDVNTAVMGSSNVEQLTDNLNALDVAKRWTPEVEKKIEELMQNKPKPDINYRTWEPFPDRRSTSLELPKA